MKANLQLLESGECQISSRMDFAKSSTDSSAKNSAPKHKDDFTYNYAFDSRHGWFRFECKSLASTGSVCAFARGSRDWYLPPGNARGLRRVEGSARGTRPLLKSVAAHVINLRTAALTPYGSLGLNTNLDEFERLLWLSLGRNDSLVLESQAPDLHRTWVIATVKAKKPGNSSFQRRILVDNDSLPVPLSLETWIEIGAKYKRLYSTQTKWDRVQGCPVPTEITWSVHKDDTVERSTVWKLRWTAINRAYKEEDFGLATLPVRDGDYTIDYVGAGRPLMGVVLGEANVLSVIDQDAPIGVLRPPQHREAIVPPSSEVSVNNFRNIDGASSIVSVG